MEAEAVALAPTPVAADDTASNNGLSKGEACEGEDKREEGRKCSRNAMIVCPVALLHSNVSCLLFDRLLLTGL
ncbi:hypothetical protein QYF36_023837 [Acer negundo]|nr:hypothetical protein QYF36_023837 [Acer negundo]